MPLKLQDPTLLREQACIAGAWVNADNGTTVAVTNPKGLIYFGALFPQFIDIQRSMPPQFALLTVIFLAMDLVWMGIYALGGRGIMRWLRSPEHQRWFNWISGGLLIAAGVALAFSKL